MTDRAVTPPLHGLSVRDGYRTTPICACRLDLGRSKLRETEVVAAQLRLWQLLDSATYKRTENQLLPRLLIEKSSPVQNLSAIEDA